MLHRWMEYESYLFLLCFMIILSSSWSLVFVTVVLIGRCVLLWSNPYNMTVISRDTNGECLQTMKHLWKDWYTIAGIPAGWAPLQFTMQTKLMDGMEIMWVTVLEKWPPTTNSIETDGWFASAGHHLHKNRNRPKTSVPWWQNWLFP